MFVRHPSPGTACDSVRKDGTASARLAMCSSRVLRVFLVIHFTASTAAALTKSSSATSVSTEGRLYTDEWSRTALSWPNSRAGVRFQGSSWVTAVLEDSGFDTHNLPAAIAFVAGATKDYEAKHEEGLVKLTLRGLDRTREWTAVITKINESDDGEVLLLRFEVDMHGRSDCLHGISAWLTC